ncbi:MAG TPA: acetylornithine deacetylase [Candidatus Nanopelagicales bacterium]|nr:acetylornithine deacetylase [Candidatus Nanopelagicales bacterium]
MSDGELRGVLERLERLCAFDTRNPPRAIDQGGLFAYLAAELQPAGFTITVNDLGDGCISLLAVRGPAARSLINVHVDTVPADPAWTRDPLRLLVEGDRATGLGACDIKGAAACLLAAAAETRGDAALLFTSDEEAGSSRCVRAFLEEHRHHARVFVAEPTRCRAVIAHRGIGTAIGEFRGKGGHASSPRALADNAVHEAVRWASRALAHAAESEARRYGELHGIRYNLGVLQGGIKANMIASTATVRFGVRPLPDQRPEDVVAAITALAPDPDRVTWTPGFTAPPLPADPARAERAEAVARELGLPLGPPVDFWTEAALFSAAGHDSVIVYGPGDIAQAHTADEWVALPDLAEASRTYRRLLDHRSSSA